MSPTKSFGGTEQILNNNYENKYNNVRILKVESRKVYVRSKIIINYQSYFVTKGIRYRNWENKCYRKIIFKYINGRYYFPKTFIFPLLFPINLFIRVFIIHISLLN